MARQLSRASCLFARRIAVVMVILRCVFTFGAYVRDVEFIVVDLMLE